MAPPMAPLLRRGFRNKLIISILENSLRKRSCSEHLTEGLCPRDLPEVLSAHEPVGSPLRSEDLLEEFFRERENPGQLSDPRTESAVQGAGQCEQILSLQQFRTSGAEFRSA